MNLVREISYWVVISLVGFGGWFNDTAADLRIRQLAAQVKFFRENCRSPQNEGDHTTLSTLNGQIECVVVKRNKRPERSYL